MNGMSKETEALRLCDELLEQIDKGKVDVSICVRKLKRIASLINDKELGAWCASEAEGYLYNGPLEDEDIEELLKNVDPDLHAKIKMLVESLPTHRRIAAKRRFETKSVSFFVGLNTSELTSMAERIRKPTSSVWTLTVNDADFELGVTATLAIIDRIITLCYDKCTKIQQRLKFAGIPPSIFEKRRETVENYLLEVCPRAMEQFMVAFTNLSSHDPERWSNAATSCRRILKNFADSIFPARPNQYKGRDVKDNNYINRIWAFADGAVDSKNQKQVVKALVDYVGAMLMEVCRLASKGTHIGKLPRYLAEQCVIYTYLLMADIISLTRLTESAKRASDLPDINKLPMEELVDDFGLNKKVAKDIVRIRARRPFRNWEDVAGIKGVGPQTIEKFKEKCTLKQPLSAN